LKLILIQLKILNIETFKSNLIVYKNTLFLFKRCSLWENEENKFESKYFSLKIGSFDYERSNLWKCLINLKLFNLNIIVDIWKIIFDFSDNIGLMTNNLSKPWNKKRSLHQISTNNQTNIVTTNKKRKLNV
jgi:hypothetical protein